MKSQKNATLNCKFFRQLKCLLSRLIFIPSLALQQGLVQPATKSAKQPFIQFVKIKIAKTSLTVDKVINFESFFWDKSEEVFSNSYICYVTKSSCMKAVNILSCKYKLTLHLTTLHTWITKTSKSSCDYVWVPLMTNSVNKSIILVYSNYINKFWQA